MGAAKKKAPVKPTAAESLAKQKADSQGGGKCAVCMTAFASNSKKPVLKQHAESKHPKQTLAQCFPGVSFD